MPRYWVKCSSVLSVLLSSLFVFQIAVSAQERPATVLIIDASRSMWGQIDKVRKITSMRNALTDNFLRYDGRLDLGLVAYGHRKAESCEDVNEIRPIQRLDGPIYADAISQIKPKGTTPIAASLNFAAQRLQSFQGRKNIILLSDGLDNCKGDPCKVSQDIHKKDRAIKIHVLAFDRKQKAQLTALQCIAKNTRGYFASATNEAELKRALSNAFDASFLITASNTNTAASQTIPLQNVTGQVSDQQNQNAPQTGAASQDQILSQPPNIKTPKGLVPVTFLALIKEGGLPIKSNIVWRIFNAKPNKSGKYKLLSTHRKARPTAALAPGEYLVNAAYGKSHLTKKIILKKGEPLSEIFVLNAGGLRLGSVLANGKPVSKNSVKYSIYSDERDQFGNRQKIITNAKPGLIIRLNAGIYHIVSQYGDANARVSADVTIEPGKLTEATINHTAATVTFKLVMEPGGEALADIRWSILTPQGEVVKDSAGALPTHILAAGNYTILARRAGQIFKREFKVDPGETKQIEVVIR